MAEFVTSRPFMEQSELVKTTEFLTFYIWDICFESWDNLRLDMWSRALNHSARTSYRRCQTITTNERAEKASGMSIIC